MRSICLRLPRTGIKRLTLARHFICLFACVFIYLVCVCILAHVYVWRWKRPFESWFSLSTMWILEIEFRLSGLVYVDPTHWPLLPLFFNTLFLAPLVFLSFYTATVLYSYCRAILPPLLCFSPNHFTVRLGEGFTSLRLQYLPRTLLRLLLHIPSFLGVKRGFLC